MTELTLPEGFIPVTERLPANDKPVLAIRKSGYISCTFEVLTARYEPEYRPLNPWRDIGNDAITDSGHEVIGWREAPEWFLAR